VSGRARRPRQAPAEQLDPVAADGPRDVERLYAGDGRRQLHKCDVVDRRITVLRPRAGPADVAGVDRDAGGGAGAPVA